MNGLGEWIGFHGLDGFGWIGLGGSDGGNKLDWFVWINLNRIELDN